MASPVRLHVRFEILAVAAQPEHHCFVTIPVGSMIETSDDLAEPGLHRVRFESKDLFAFTRDIRERTRPVTTSNSLPERSRR